MIALALETGTPCSSFFVFRMSLQKDCLLSSLMEHQALMSFKASPQNFAHFECLLNEVAFVLFSSGKFPKGIKKFFMFISDIFFINEKQLTHINEVDISFYHDLIKVMKNLTRPHLPADLARALRIVQGQQLLLIYHV